MNPWDELTDIFAFSRDDGAIPECAADNVCIAWPSLIHCIQRHFDRPGRRKALDFGCGGGWYCSELSKMGFDVTGYDSSEKLVQAARVQAPKGVTITDSRSVAAERGKYDLITAIMVFQFIENIESVIGELVSLLEPDGLIAFAAFNPRFIEENLGGGVFSGFGKSRSGFVELKKGVRVRCFDRTDGEYRSMFDGLGFEEVYRDYPEFTADFLAKYKMPFSTQSSEFLIQAFARRSAKANA